jgi:hypothetical protein
MGNCWYRPYSDSRIDMSPPAYSTATTDGLLPSVGFSAKSKELIIIRLLFGAKDTIATRRN